MTPHGEHQDADGRTESAQSKSSNGRAVTRPSDDSETKEFTTDGLALPKTEEQVDAEHACRAHKGGDWYGRTDRPSWQGHRDA